MRKFSILVAVVLGVAAAAAFAQEIQTTFTVDAQVVPNRAGTPAKPQGVKIKTSARFTSPEGVDPPVVTHGYALFPRAGSYNPQRFPRCSEAVLNRRGPTACAKGSHIGSARASAYADNIITYPKIEIFNGGPNVAWAYVTLYQPALVEMAVAARIEEIPSGKWKYKVSVKIPEVLQVVAGIPIAARSIKGWVGKGDLITTFTCPKNRRWPFEVTTYFTVGKPYTYRDYVPCLPAR